MQTTGSWAQQPVRIWVEKSATGPKSVEPRGHVWGLLALPQLPQ
jgi:hypothetical protein